MTTETNKVKQLLPLLTAGLLILGGLTGLNSVIGSDHWDPEPEPDPGSDRFLLDIADFDQASAYGAWDDDETDQTSKAVAFGAGARPLMNTHTQDLRDVVYRVGMTAPDNAEIGFVGLVLHHQAPTNEGDHYDTIIVDWMSGDNNPPTGHNATEGLTMYHIEGTVPDNDADMLACFWEKDDATCPADIDILATQQGSNTGWVPGEEYEFRVNFRGDNFPSQSGIKFDIRTDNQSSPYFTAFPDTFKDVLQMGHYELEPAQFGYYTFRQGAAVFSNATFSDHIKPELEVDAECLDLAPEGGCLGPYEVEVTSVTDQGSGVANVTCTVDGDPMFDCDIAPFEMDGHGAHNVLVEAFDHAGNRAFQTRSFVIDQEAPVVSAEIDCLGDVVGGFCNGNGQLDTSASALSGIDSLVCELDSGNGTQSVACDDVIDEDGDHTFTANATSNVGFSAEASTTFLRDATSPDGDIIEPTPGCIYQDDEPTMCPGTTIVSGNLTFNVLGQDPSVNNVSAGMDRVEFHVDGEEFANITGDGDDGWYNATWSPEGEGERTVEVLLIDNAGNVEVLEFEALVLPLEFVPGVPEAPGATIPGLPTDNRQAALDGADRLLDVQFESGAFPYIIGSPDEHQNVQGTTALGLLDAYTLSLDDGYLANATANRDWLVNYTEEDQGLHSAPSFYFLAKYALLSGNLDDLEFARGILQERLDAHGNATALAELILNFRNNSVHTNMGVWDVALYVRGAHDVGMTNVSAEFADVLAEQTTEDGIVDAFNETNSWYTLGLSGLLFGLSEGDALGHDSVIQEASDRLLATQCEDGSFEEVFGGETFCSSVQTTAYSVIGLQHALSDPLAAFAGCDFIRAAQNETTGGWPYSSGTEYAIINSEAVQALAACVVPVHNAATSYADGPVAGNLPVASDPQDPSGSLNDALSEADDLVPIPLSGVNDLNDGWVHIIQPQNAVMNGTVITQIEPDENGDLVIDVETWWLGSVGSLPERRPIGGSDFPHASLAFSSLDTCLGDPVACAPEPGPGSAFYSTGWSSSSTTTEVSSDLKRVTYKVPVADLHDNHDGNVSEFAVWHHLNYKPREEGGPGYSFGAEKRSDHPGKDADLCRQDVQPHVNCPASGGFGSSVKNQLFFEGFGDQDPYGNESGDAEGTPYGTNDMVVDLLGGDSGGREAELGYKGWLDRLEYALTGYSL